MKNKVEEKKIISDILDKYQVYHETKARIQKILDYGLKLSEDKHVANDMMLKGSLPDGMIVDFTNVSIIGQIGFMDINWGQDYIRIQYDSETKKILDSAKWKNRVYLGVGHIQTAYSREYRDKMFTFGLVELLQTVQDWKIHPRQKPER